MALYKDTELSRYINGLRINLWHYLGTISKYIAKLTDPDYYDRWYVELRDLQISGDVVKFAIVLVIDGESVRLQDVNAGGLIDGRLQIDDGGVWLDMSINGNPLSLMDGVNTVRLDNAVVVIPPAIATYNTYKISVRDGLHASYVPTTNGGMLTIAVDRLAATRIQEKQQSGIKSINGATPVDGDIIIQGSGDVKVQVIKEPYNE